MHCQRTISNFTSHKLKDLIGDEIKGTFYSDELQIVSKPDDALFDRERIVRTRKRAGMVRVSGQVARMFRQV